MSGFGLARALALLATLCAGMAIGTAFFYAWTVTLVWAALAVAGTLCCRYESRRVLETRAVERRIKRAGMHVQLVLYERWIVDGVDNGPTPIIRKPFRSGTA